MSLKDVAKQGKTVEDENSGEEKERYRPPEGGP